MSSDIRVRAKAKNIERENRNKSLRKKEEPSILPWDIEPGEEEF